MNAEEYQTFCYSRTKSALESKQATEAHTYMLTVYLQYKKITIKMKCYLAVCVACRNLSVYVTINVYSSVYNDTHGDYFDAYRKFHAFGTHLFCTLYNTVSVATKKIYMFRT